ncbi:unnamed protein product [Vitrella brassicaformis CCMP3155]|uniref:Macro domain-containing protein n=1 Tax=Vitrella brassicaformis (strain CCMP3155) TaxID=1169540 RepID=A0A0G4FL84_VITBC|nr:unnamed protein product [Vitrella brassicaformis CCMP3155]|eukprot:CEM14676.1 unnamed protein product [Vitrella brassicaformis CCMP3155]
MSHRRTSKLLKSIVALPWRERFHRNLKLASCLIKVPSAERDLCSGQWLTVPCRMLHRFLQPSKFAVVSCHRVKQAAPGSFLVMAGFLFGGSRQSGSAARRRAVDVLDFPTRATDTDPENSPLRKVSLYQGDITSLKCDAIVNAANQSLLGGGGVDGAIHDKAGDELRRYCRTLGGCDTGSAKISPGFRLPATHIIHAVGPIGEKPALLRSCYTTSLNILKENGLRSIVFCCISTGIFGYPNARAAKVALGAVRDWLSDADNYASVDRVVFCTFLAKDQDIYERIMDGVLRGEDEEPQEEQKEEEEDEGEAAEGEGEEEKAAEGQESDKKEGDKPDENKPEETTNKPAPAADTKAQGEEQQAPEQTGGGENPEQEQPPAPAHDTIMQDAPAAAAVAGAGDATGEGTAAGSGTGVVKRSADGEIKTQKKE